MWKRLLAIPYESCIGIFVIINGVLTLFPSAVKESLWNLVGYPGLVVPFMQIAAGGIKLTGIAKNKSNIEACGLIMVMSMFLIRAISLLADGNITLSDINSCSIAVLIAISNTVRLIQIVKNKPTIFVNKT